jgi:hypothetical protein
MRHVDPRSLILLAAILGAHPGAVLAQAPDETEPPVAPVVEPAQAATETAAATTTPPATPGAPTPTPAPDATVDPPPPVVTHAPHNAAQDGDALRFDVHVRGPDLVDAVIVRVRAAGSDAEPIEAIAHRVPGGFAADVAGEHVQAPAIEYWVVARLGDAEQAVFASPDAPHVVHVTESALAIHERTMLTRREGRRARAGVRGEMVYLGQQRRLEAGASALSAQYYRLEASYAHGFFTIVDEIRFSLGRMRGVVEGVGDDPGPRDPGMDYGTAEITWFAHDLVRFRTAILFGFSQVGFEWGGGLAMTIGDPDSTSLTLGVDGATTVGLAGKLRLGWLTIPRVPMGATIEVTGYPLGDETGMRLLYDVGYEIYPGAIVRVEAGYRGWASTAGGPSLGGEMTFAF